MRINKKTLASSIGSALGLMVLATAPAMAASTFSDHLWQFADGGATNLINFNKGGSVVYDDGHLHVATDDMLFLDASLLTVLGNNARVNGQMELGNNQLGGVYTGSRIFDNNELNITTDDNLNINAPGTTTVSGALTATGAITGNLTGNVTGNTAGVHTGAVTGNVTGNLTGNVTGNTAGVHTGAVTGNVTGDLTGNVTGNVTGNLTGNVTGDVTGNVTGNLTGNVTTNAINATSSGTVMHIGESTDVVILGATGNVTNVAGTLTTDGTVTVGGDITLQNGETINNTTDGIIGLTGELAVTPTRVDNGSGYAYLVNINDGGGSGSGAMTGGAATKTYAVNASVNRPTASAATGDSNDSVIKASYNNYAANDTNFIVRGINSGINNRSGGTLGILEGGSIGAQGKSGGTAGTVRGLTVTPENYGTVSDEFGGIDVVLKNEGAVATTEYGLRVRNLNNSLGTAVDAGYLLSNTGTNTGFTYGLDMNGATIGTADIRLAAGTTIGSGAANPAACVKGSIYLNTTSGALNVCETTDIWTAK